MSSTPTYGTQSENVDAEIDSYTNYCKLLDYEAAKAKEYADKAAASLKNSANLKVAQFPYGVGPAIVAGKAVAKQIARMAKDVEEGIETAESCMKKLAKLYPPEKPCK